MSLRETMNNNPAVATGSVVGILLIALTVIWFTQCRGSGGGGSLDAAYFDTSTGKLVIVKATPGANPSPLADNANAFRCSIFSCSECGEITEGMTLEDLEANGMYIGFLSRDPASADSGGVSPLEAGMMGEEVCSVDDLNWLSMADGEAYSQFRAKATACEGGRANPCSP